MADDDAPFAVFSFDNELFRIFATYSALVVLKMLALSLFTIYQRFRCNAFPNREDYKYADHDKIPKEKLADELIKRNENVERVRRCHQNDLENIIPFLIVGLLYVASGPSQRFAIFHFRTFAAFRFGHTISYLTPLPQPARFIAFIVGYLVNVSMALQVIFMDNFEGQKRIRNTPVLQT